MEPSGLRALLEAHKAGTLDIEDALRALTTGEPSAGGLSYASVDTARAPAKGAPEVVYGASKTAEQLTGIVDHLVSVGQAALVTRLDPGKAESIRARHPDAIYHPVARVLHRPAGPWVDRGQGSVLVICAGTSDLPVAEEAAVVAEAFGNRVQRITDVGVAGLHRLLRHTAALREARVLIVVAGMEGALPSVVAGLTDRPVIAVPTSVGYGAAFGGLAAPLAMLNSCAAGVSVVNIDNGFGAAYQATQINRLP